jgi:hypothetical protein
VYPSSYPFNLARARATASFVDSLAQAFDVLAPEQIEYYFTADLSETFRAVGLDFFPLATDTVGGRSLTANNLILVGSSQSGEAYRHEVSHILLSPLIGLNTAQLVSEGLMTWTGGSAGHSFLQLMQPLRSYLNEHPDLSLHGILTDPPDRQGTLDVGFAALAVLCKMVHDVGGVSAIRSLLDAGRSPDDVLDTAARIVQLPRAQLDSAWRSAVDALAR